MAIRRWWLIACAIMASGMAMAAPDTPASDGLTNAVADNTRPAPLAEPVDEDQLRDPFWPVGYSPVTKKVVVAAGTAAASAALPDSVGDTEIKKALAMIQVGGIIRRGTKFYATVNGFMVEPGDTIPVMVDERVVAFIVRSIDMRRIRIEPVVKKSPVGADISP